MTESDTLTPFRLKTERARRHMGELHARCEAFVKDMPYAVGFKAGVSGGTDAYVVTRAVDPPLVIAAIAGDVAHNLRSALDHVAYRLVTLGRGTAPTKKDRVCYPFVDDPANYKAERGRAVKGATQAALDAIDATKPYPGGNDLLASIRHLDDVDKHRVLLVVGSAFQSVDLGRVGRWGFEDMPEFPADWPYNKSDVLAMPWPKAFFRSEPAHFPLKLGDVLLSGSKLKRDENLEFRFEIAFGEPEVLRGKPLLETLKSATDLVDNLIADFAPLLA